MFAGAYLVLALECMWQVFVLPFMALFRRFQRVERVVMGGDCGSVFGESLKFGVCFVGVVDFSLLGGPGCLVVCAGDGVIAVAFLRVSDSVAAVVVGECGGAGVEGRDDEGLLERLLGGEDGWEELGGLA